MSQEQASGSAAVAIGEETQMPSPAYRYYVLAILVFVYMLNFVDRQIIGILAAPLKAEFNMSDSQFGLLGGIAFASVYSTLAIPLAWLADRSSRVWIMTGARPSGRALPHCVAWRVRSVSSSCSAWGWVSVRPVVWLRPIR